MIPKLTEFLRPALKVNHRLYLAVFPFALLASVASYATEGDFLLSIWYLIANLLSFAIVGVVYLVSYRWIRPEGKLVVFPIVAFGLLLGFTKQLTTAAIVVAFSLEGSLMEAIGSRAVTPLLGVWSSLSVSLIAAGQVRFGKLREDLIAERVRVLSRDKASQSSELREFAEEASRLLRSSEGLEAKEIAGLVRDIVQQKLRPLSHDLWDREERRTPGFGTKELARRALTSRPYRSLWITSLFLLGALQPIVNLSSGNILPALVAATLPVFLSLVFANLVRKRFEIAKRSFVATLTLTSASGGLFGTLWLYLLGIAPNPMMVLTSSWWMGTLILVVGMFAVAIEDYSKQRELMAELLENDLDQEAMSSIRTIRNRELANLLHSKTQNKMLAQAMRLESGGDIGAELEDLRRMLKQLPETNMEEPTPEDLSARWRGIINLSWQLDCEPTELQLRIVEEAISNAYRHGLANEISITLTSDEILVLDNGLGPTSGKPGLGSSLFESSGSWSLEAREAGGSQLRIRL